MCNYLDKENMKEFLDEREMSHLYDDDTATLISNLENAKVIKGVVYEPEFHKNTFNGVNKIGSFRVLFKI